MNTTFVNFQDNDMRKTGALSWLLFTSSGVTTASTIKEAEFVNAKPVYFPNIDPRFDNDNSGGVAYRTLSIHDLDGSVIGIPDSHIILHDGDNDSVVTDDTSEIHPTWNASVCTGDVGRLSMRGGGGRGFGGFGGRGGGAFGGRGGGGPGGADQPIVLVRDGKEHNITGNQSTVRAGTEIRVQTERPEVTFSLSEMDKDSWVIFELPGFANASAGTEQDSLGALRNSSETSYFRGDNSLWVKLVVPQDPVPPVRPLENQASISVSR